MVQADFDFSDSTLSGEERLASLRALNSGLCLALQHLFRRVRSYNDLLEEELEERPAAVEYLEKSNSAADAALEWLDAFRCTTRGDTPAVEPLAVRILFEGVVKRCQDMLAGKNDLVVTLPNDEIVVEGSLFQLQDLFMKTILTAVERTPDNTAAPILIRASEQQVGEDSFRLLRSQCGGGGYFVVAIGCDDEDFDSGRLSPFWDVLLDHYGGRPNEDLVLFQTYGLILAHGGDLFFAERASGGHGVCLLLPVKAKRKDMQAAHNVGDETLYGTETILLVDDEDMIWDVIIDMLQELGYSVILAGNGVEAVEIYRENPGEIDLVLLDMAMPEMDGHEAFFKLKEVDPDVVVLLSSGYVSEADAQDVLDAGAVGFLQKPYRMIDLAKRIRTVFDAKPCG